jgi:hypothetical protein
LEGHAGTREDWPAGSPRIPLLGQGIVGAALSVPKSARPHRVLPDDRSGVAPSLSRGRTTRTNLTPAWPGRKSDYGERVGR